MKFAVITEAEDGTLGVMGPFGTELAATLWANDHETEDSGYVCHVREMETP